MNGRIAAVVLSWNDADRVLAFLERLHELDLRPDRVIVVDNGSVDGSPDRIAAAFGTCQVVRLAENRGYAGGANAGIELAMSEGADWIWLLNTDLSLPSDVLSALARGAGDDPRCGMIAPVLVETDGSVQAWGGGRVNLWTGVSRHLTSKTEQPHYLSGACLLLRAAMLREVGLFDERYFFYWEDVDLGFRAREAGWTLAVADDCRVEHREGSTLGRWSAARWHFLFTGLPHFLRGRAFLPTLAFTLRLLHHSAAMARHRRWEAMRGAWLGAAAQWRGRWRG
ncbi:MAG: glycosyltransferase family 2 protein [Deltaproteobacteria bacterium]|nr:glycosyltransferase family 2 protein [Deltaproteobacteria bacterium]